MPGWMLLKPKTSRFWNKLRDHGQTISHQSFFDFIISTVWAMKTCWNVSADAQIWESDFRKTKKRREKKKETEKNKKQYILRRTRRWLRRRRHLRRTRRGTRKDKVEDQEELRQTGQEKENKDDNIATRRKHPRKRRGGGWWLNKTKKNWLEKQTKRVNENGKSKQRGRRNLREDDKEQQKKTMTIET